MTDPAAQPPHAPVRDLYKNKSLVPWSGVTSPGIVVRSYNLPQGVQPLLGLPMPPFASKEEHKVFLDSLRFHVAALGGVDGTVPAAILNGMFSTVDLASPTLSELELQVCWQSFFPAPWEFTDLAELVNDRQRSFRPTAEGGWRWLFDPEFEAKPDPAGGWMILRHERGWFEQDKLDGDYDLCLFWMSMMSDRGWGTGEYEFARQQFLAPEAVAAVRESRSAQFNVAQAMADGVDEEDAAAVPVPALENEPKPAAAGWLKRMLGRGR